MPNGREKISPAITPISSCAMLIKTLLKTTSSNSYEKNLMLILLSDLSLLQSNQFFLKFLFQVHLINVKSMMTILNNCFSTICSVFLQKPLVSKVKRKRDI